MNDYEDSDDFKITKREYINLGTYIQDGPKK